MDPVSFTWKSITKLAPLPLVFESYQEEPNCEEKRRETAVDVEWKKEMETYNKIPSDIVDKYASVIVKPKKKPEKKSEAFFAWRELARDGYLPPKRCTPPPLNNAWEQKPGKQLFKPISRSLLVSSGELKDLRKATQNGLSTLEDDAERRRRNYIKMFGNPDISGINAHRFWNTRSELEEPYHPKHDTDEDWDAYIPQPKKPEPVPMKKSEHVNIPPGLPPCLQMLALEKQKRMEKRRGKGDPRSQNSSVTEQKSARTTHCKSSRDFSAQFDFKSEEPVASVVENPQEKQRAFVPLADTESSPDTTWNTPRPQMRPESFNPKVDLPSHTQFLQPQPPYPRPDLAEEELILHFVSKKIRTLI